MDYHVIQNKSKIISYNHIINLKPSIFIIQKTTLELFISTFEIHHVETHLQDMSIFQRSNLFYSHISFINGTLVFQREKK